MSFVIKSLHTLMSWVLGAQVMMLFGEVVETLGGGAQLEEEDTWDCVFDGYMWFLTPSLTYFLLAFATHVPIPMTFYVTVFQNQWG